MNSSLLSLLTFILLLTLTSVVLAQPGLPDPPPQTPVDGGLVLLAAAGGAYALKKLRGRNEEELE